MKHTQIILHRNKDLWTYDYNANIWTQFKLEADSLPGLVSGHTMVYNASADKAMIFGGLEQAEQQASDKTWVFDLNTVTWTEMTPGE